MGFILNNKVSQGGVGDGGFLNLNVSSGPAPYIWVDPDGQDWYTRVVSSGGSITNANQAAFDTAFLSLKSTNGPDFNPLWSHINQGYWFIGQESLTNGLMVPFYRSDVSGGSAVWGQNATNNNFTTYTKTGGIVGDGSTTFVQTTINNNNNTDWPTITSSAGRMGYVYLSNTRNGDFQRAFHPFGTITGTSRAFGLSASSTSDSVTWRVSNNAATQTSGTQIPIFGEGNVWEDGGYGIIVNSSEATARVSLGTGKAYQFGMSSPSSSSLTNSPMCIGRSTSSYSQCNIKCAILGTKWLYDLSNPLNEQSFYLVDGIVNTLVASLT